MTVIIIILAIAGYFTLRQFWFGKRRIKHFASIDRIQLCTIAPDIFLPEVSISYKYYVGGGVYKGRGYVSLLDFIGETDYKLFYNSNMLPVLWISDKQFVSEEHIESFLLEIFDTVCIYYDPIEPFHSEIIELHSNSIGAEKI
ncbi:MAG: hypothetical protein N3A69_13950 [Leptospiraceae bacterium]|nr:hypothetical protein [Leptospiraceae bacterium]